MHLPPASSLLSLITHDDFSNGLIFLDIEIFIISSDKHDEIFILCNETALLYPAVQFHLQ